jgi:hypothetical protein
VPALLSATENPCDRCCRRQPTLRRPPWGRLLQWGRGRGGTAEGEQLRTPTGEGGGKWRPPSLGAHRTAGFSPADGWIQPNSWFQRF